MSKRTPLKMSIKRIDKDMPLPKYALPGDGGLDLYSSDKAVLEPGGGRMSIGTGIAIALPEGYAGFVLPRSGLATKHGVSVVNAPGLIDSGYRGEIRVPVINTDPETSFTIHRGERIAQLVVQAVEKVEWDEVEELTETERGAGGFGHTGIK